MTSVRGVFDASNGRPTLKSISIVPGAHNDDLPWQRIKNGELPPMMFQLRFQNGDLKSYAYSDLREIHCNGSGKIELFVYSIEKQVITLEGRNLGELASLLGRAKICAIAETDPRDVDRPENAPTIDRVLVEIVGKLEG